MDWSAGLIKLAEDNVVSWESLARECIAQMSVDDAHDVAVALEVDEEIECPFDDDIEDDVYNFKPLSFS